MTKKWLSFIRNQKTKDFQFGGLRRHNVKKLILESGRSSLKSAFLILKLVIPFYILADILIHFDLLRPVSFLFSPVTGILGLPPETAMAIAAGILLNLYAGVAFAAPLGLTPYEWTILGVFLGVCHSMPVECTVMKKLGINYSYSILLRGIMAFITVLPVMLLPRSWFGGSLLQADVGLKSYDTILEMLFSSLTNAVFLSAKIILLITVIIFFMDFLKTTRLLQASGSRLNTSFSFLAGQLLGITYGAGIILKEADSGNLSRRNIMFIGTFLMICHSLLEDPLLFVLFGANYWIMTMARLLMAIIVSYLLSRFTGDRLFSGSTSVTVQRGCYDPDITDTL